MEMTEGIVKHLRNEVEDITEEGIKENLPNMIMIDLYVRHYFRGEVVKTLVDAGLKVACFGAGWDLARLPPSGEHHQWQAAGFIWMPQGH